MNARELKEKIKRKELILGMQQFIPSPQITEIAGLAGFDWLWFCVEHGTSGFGTELENIMRAAENVGIVPFVRITDSTQYWMYQKAMEAGAKGIIAPRIRTKKDAEFAVKQVKWPGGPYNGNHGICPAARRWRYGLDAFRPGKEDFIDRDEAETFVIPLLEDVEAVNNIDEICSVKGIDFIIFGPGDLGMSLGYWGRGKEMWKKGEKVVEELRLKVKKACDRSGVPYCGLCHTVEEANKLIDEGVYILNPGTVDTAFIEKTWEELLKGIRKLKK